MFYCYGKLPDVSLEIMITAGLAGVLSGFIEQIKKRSWKRYEI